MKLRLAVLLFLVVVSSGTSYSQERVAPVEPQRSEVPAEARFEIVQVSYLREVLVLKLDKYTGEVFELARNRDYVRDKGQGNAWQLTKRPLAEEMEYKVNFQIFGSVHGEGSVFLINVNNGDTWTLYREQVADRDLTWVLMKTQKK